MDLRKVRGLRSRLGSPSSRSSTRLYIRHLRRRDALREAKTESLFRFLEMIPGQNKSLLNSLIDLDLILLISEQSLNPGGNNLDLPFTASIRRKKSFSSGQRTSIVLRWSPTERSHRRHFTPSWMRITKRKWTPCA